jgi:cytochrome c
MRSPVGVRRSSVAAAVALALGVPLAHAGDAARGAQLYEVRCGGCHSVDADRIGPRHAGLAGRKAGSIADFDYSPALRASPVVWTAATLDRWLADPEALIAGQRMGYRLDSAAERADIIAWLLGLEPAASAANSSNAIMRRPSLRSSAASTARAASAAVR